MPSGRSKGSGHIVKHRRVPLNIREHFVTAGVAEHWHKLPRKVVESHPWLDQVFSRGHPKGTLTLPSLEHSEV